MNHAMNFVPAAAAGEMTEDERLRHFAAQIRAEASRLVEMAKACGLNVEISTRPRQPLAMGNYELAVQVWPRKGA